MKGTIKRLVTDKGFGFIDWEGKPAGDKDLFFHQSEVVGTTFQDLKEGDAVTFEKGEGPKGPQATKIQRAS